MDSKIRNYDGTGEIKVFLEKVSLHSSLKGYDGEKAAQNLTSKLEGRAFDVYVRLPAGDKKHVEKIHTELLKEFEHGNQTREAAIFELNNRKREKDESPQTFTFKLLELVKLAYPSFEDEALKTIAKDYFIRGVHPNMQVALKLAPDFATASIDKLAIEKSRLQIAGIKSFASTAPTEPHECMSVNSPSIDDIVSKVMQKLSMDSENKDGGQLEPDSANFVGSQFRGRRNRGSYSPPVKTTNIEGKLVEERQWAHVLVSLVENFVPVKALTMLSEIAPPASAKPAETEAMIPGIGPAQSFNDYMDLATITP